MNIASGFFGLGIALIFVSFIAIIVSACIGLGKQWVLTFLCIFLAGIFLASAYEQPRTDVKCPAGQWLTSRGCKPTGT